MADLHLGAKFADLSYEKAQLRRSELRQSFSGCVASHCDAGIVLIAGDIFDAPDVSVSEAEFMVSVILKYPQTKFLMVCGNHDPYNSPIYEYMCGILPENAVLFTPDGDEIVFEDLKVRVWGISFQNSMAEKSLLQNIKMPDDDYVNLLLVHGDLYSDNSPYNPITVEQLVSTGADYAALGHVHKFEKINKSAGTTYAYSGTHEGHGYDECGRCGCIYGKVAKNMADVNFECTSLRTYERLDIDISGAKTIEAVKKLIEDAVTGENLYYITLTGELNEGVILNEFVLLSGIDAFDIRLKTEVCEPYKLEELACEANLKGYFVKTALSELEKAESEEDKKIINQAVRCVLDAFGEGTKGRKLKS